MTDEEIAEALNSVRHTLDAHTQDAHKHWGRAREPARDA